MSKRFFSSIALLALAACGGGAGTSSSALPSSAAAKLQSVGVNFGIKIPSSTARQPKYISSGTKVVSVVVTPTGGAALAAQTIACAGTECTGTIQAPVGSDQFSVTLSDAGNHVLSQGSTTSTIIAGQANDVTVTFGGVVSSIVITVASPTVSSSGSIPVTVTAKDAAGYTIVSENYVNPITVVDSDSAHTSLSTTNVPAPGTAVNLNYDGSPAFTNATITASASGVNGSSVTPAVVSRGTGSAASATAAYMTQTSATKVNGTLAAGIGNGVIAAISEAPDQYQNGVTNSITTSTLTIGTGSSAQSVIRVPQKTIPFMVGPRGSARTPVERFAADDGQVQKLLARLPHRAGSAPIVRSSSVFPTNPTVGSTANVWTAIFSIGSSGSNYVQVPSTMEFQSAHGNIWVDNSLLSGAHASSAFSSANLSATAAALGADFENAYTSDTTHFAAPDYPASAPGLQTNYGTCDSSGNHTGNTAAQYVLEPADGRINVEILNSANLGAGVGGYFTGTNYTPQAIWNCLNPIPMSNEAPMFYVGWFDGSGSTYELEEDIVRGTAHEFQHEINFVNHEILNPNNGAEDSFINEGLSMLSQDLAVHQKFPTQAFDAEDALFHASAYLGAPQNYSVTGFIGIDGPDWGGDNMTPKYNCGGGCYGAAYLFQRYMYDRFGGDTYTHGMEHSNVQGFANIAANGGTETASQLLGDFAVALATNSQGVAVAGTSPFNFGTLNLNGTYTGQFGSRTLTGIAMIQAPSNAATTSFVVLGGNAYYQVTGIPPAGEALSVVDTGGTANLVGGLVQH